MLILENFNDRGYFAGFTLLCVGFDWEKMIARRQIRPFSSRAALRRCSVSRYAFAL